MKNEEKQCKIGCVVGTRPEIIKMAPVIFSLRACPWADVRLINTGQHRDLLDSMLDIFQLKADVDLNIMSEDQSLGRLTGHLCLKLDEVLKKNPVDIVLAAGDTTSVFVASLLAFYHKISFAHIEAGLRTYDVNQPFPEEINRRLTAPLSVWHYAPTDKEKQNLLKENIPIERILVTGNPVIDAMYWVLENKVDEKPYKDLEKIIIVTAHRRENFGENLHHICEALIALTQRFPDINFLLPVHPNPHVQHEIQHYLGHSKGIYLIPPMRYDTFVHLMNRSLFIMTDSGGIQEEAPALKKPVIVMRETTERSEVIREKLGFLVGTDKDKIIQAATQLLTDASLYKQMARGLSPYGDGKAAQRIVHHLQQHVFRP
ncbi:MAG: UDP-N-acetylglucosamine 2-epimerase (non-hydrolyzing) [Legionellaceae bacterium]|nr:UDP-N-acetylglucosamine 2-epimerase (non-hydrolyzing) [Legionellaceae bacterium]